VEPAGAVETEERPWRARGSGGAARTEETPRARRWGGGCGRNGGETPGAPVWSRRVRLGLRRAPGAQVGGERGWD